MGRSPASAMPMAAPVMASSARGVPNTRSGPYFCCRPLVVPWMALGSSTSSPKMMTDVSRAISWSVASRTASVYEIVLSISGFLANIGEQLGVIREGALLGKRKRLLYLLLHGSFDFLAPGGLDLRPNFRHLVLLHPRFSLAPGPIPKLIILVGADVLLPAVGHAFEEVRPRLPGSNGIHRRLHALVNLERVVVLDPLGGHAIDPGPFENIGAGLPQFLVRMDGVAVVLADENNRQRLECRPVETFVEDTLVCRAVADETDHNRILPPIFESVGVTDGIGQGCAHNG